MQLALSCLYFTVTFFSVLLQPVSNLELQPEGVAYENIKNNKQTRESTPGQYQDLNLQTQENPGQYQELVNTPETSVNNKNYITYENTKMEIQNKCGTKNQSEQSQYEELNIRNERKYEHAYSEVSMR